MGRNKGGKNKSYRFWSKDDKLRIINRVLRDFNTIMYVANDEDISTGLLCNWIKKYQLDGEEGLENKKKPGNPLSKYQNRNNLNENEKLQYENMKLKIEIARLKKGYELKGDGQIVIYSGLSKKNLK